MTPLSDGKDDTHRWIRYFPAAKIKHCDLDNLQKESVFGITDLDDLVHGGGAEAAGDRHGNWTRNWEHMS